MEILKILKKIFQTIGNKQKLNRRNKYVKKKDFNILFQPYQYILNTNGLTIPNKRQRMLDWIQIKFLKQDPPKCSLQEIFKYKDI